MARSRNIKPGFFENEVLGTLDPIISLTFAGLWCLADKDGILEDRPMYIKGKLFAHRDGVDVNGYLNVLQQHGFIVRYVVDGVGYIQVIEFKKHQHPHHTEKPKGYPKPPGKAQQPPAPQGEQTLAPLNTSASTEEKSVSPSDSGFRIPDSLIPETRQASIVDKSTDVDNFGPVCVVLDREGIRGTNTEDPAFLDLVAKGATLQLWAQAAVIAADAENPTFAYVLGIVRNKLAAHEPRTPGNPARAPDPESRAIAAAAAVAVNASIEADRKAHAEHAAKAVPPPAEQRLRWAEMKKQIKSVTRKVA